ncbi:hypothetical protein ACFWN1_14175 [Streptomyces sp. NPDC058459]|uniref:hypothetical protein n=1 Tax=Streptomyces sp. NPDC058459 TaxID=3346508 RepID=UPI00364B6DED
MHAHTVPFDGFDPLDVIAPHEVPAGEAGERRQDEPVPVVPGRTPTTVRRRGLAPVGV